MGDGYTLTVDLEEFDSLNADAQAAFDQLEADLGDATETAAKAGIEETQANHPYTDRTYQLTETARAERVGPMESEMQWPKEYSGFVDEGTSRSAAYPFTPIALARAEASLDQEADRAVERFVEKVSR